MLGIVGLCLPDLLGVPNFLVDAINTKSVGAWQVIVIFTLAIVDAARLRQSISEPRVSARAYPGKSFDLLGITKKRAPGPPPGAGVYSSWVGGPIGWLLGGWWWQKPTLSSKQFKELKGKELLNGRLAMLAFAGCVSAALVTGESPVGLLQEHLSDPFNNTVMQRLHLS